MINATVKMSSQGQITIPRGIRESMGVEAGSELIITANLGKLKGATLTPKPTSWIDIVAGTGKGIWGKDTDQYVNSVRDAW